MFDYQGPTYYKFVTMSADSKQIITPLDVLRLVNVINSQTSQSLAAAGEPVDVSYDVNADGVVTALDVLLVVNYLCPSWPGG